MDLVSQIVVEKDWKKQKNLIILLMKTTDFEHPAISPILQEFKLTPEELKDPSDRPTDHSFPNSPKSEILSHHEARRLAKIEVIAEMLQQRKVFSKFSTNSRTTLHYSPSKNMKSYKSILASDPDVPLAIPINQNVISQRQIEFQHKKLERLLKVSENIKIIRIEEEKRKMDLAKDLEEKNEKLKLNKIEEEEERSRRKIEADTKRQSKLRKKYEVSDRKEIDNLEMKAIQEFKMVPVKKPGHERSKTSLTVRANNYSQYVLIRIF